MLDLTTLQTYGLAVAAADDGAVANTYQASSKHYRITAAQYRGYRLEAGPYGPSTKKLLITAGSDTVYLPFWQNNISSVELPDTGPTLFVTDNMSGCCFYLGQRSDKKLVAFHANSELNSGKADLDGKAANYQHQNTLSALDGLAKIAKSEANVLTFVGGCGKAQYNQGVARSGKDWLGGTTIVGFRKGTSWEFWYQTWGSLGGDAVKVQEVKKIWPV